MPKIADKILEKLYLVALIPIDKKKNTTEFSPEKIGNDDPPYSVMPHWFCDPWKFLSNEPSALWILSLCDSGWLLSDPVEESRGRQTSSEKLSVARPDRNHPRADHVRLRSAAHGESFQARTGTGQSRQEQNRTEWFTTSQTGTCQIGHNSSTDRAYSEGRSLPNQTRADQTRPELTRPDDSDQHTVAAQSALLHDLKGSLLKANIGTHISPAEFMRFYWFWRISERLLHLLDKLPNCQWYKYS